MKEKIGVILLFQLFGERERWYRTFFGMVWSQQPPLFFFVLFISALLKPLLGERVVILLDCSRTFSCRIFVYQGYHNPFVSFSVSYTVLKILCNSAIIGSPLALNTSAVMASLTVPFLFSILTIVFLISSVFLSPWFLASNGELEWLKLFLDLAGILRKSKCYFIWFDV